MSEPDPVAEEDRILAKTVEFIRQGMRGGNISAESGELLVDAAETHHRAKVAELRAAAELARELHPNPWDRR
jgi:hypothetical protein